MQQFFREIGMLFGNAHLLSSETKKNAKIVLRPSNSNLAR